MGIAGAKRHLADTPDGQIHYVVAGSGEPVLLLHQIGQAVDQYRKVLPALAARHRVIAMDLPGYGGSDVPPKPYATTGEYAQAVLRFLDAIDLPAVNLVGARFGGSIAVEVAASAPARVKSLVVSTCSHLDPAARNAKGSDPKYRPMQIQPDGSHLTKQFLRSLGVAEGQGPELAHDFVAMYLRSGNGLRAEDGHDALYTYDIQERLPLLQCPTLLVYGTGDEYYARREITAKLIRRCRIEVIEGARSLAMYTHPEKYADAILRFLANPGV